MYKIFFWLSFYGKVDKTGLNYIACVASKKSSSIKPWNSINESKESTIAKKMEYAINEYVLDNKEINELFEKKIFLTLEESKIIPDSLDIKLWTTFLSTISKFSYKRYSTFHSCI